jgi:predicted phage terminase large subunit-like protein
MYLARAIGPEQSGAVFYGCLRTFTLARLIFGACLALIRTPLKERYGKAASIVIEDGGISYGLIQSLREKHINVVDYKPKGDKAERLISQIDLFMGGSVLLPRVEPWLEAFVAELLSFPGPP